MTDTGLVLDSAAVIAWLYNSTDPQTAAAIAAGDSCTSSLALAEVTRALPAAEMRFVGALVDVVDFTVTDAVAVRELPARLTLADAATLLLVETRPHTVLVTANPGLAKDLEAARVHLLDLGPSGDAQT